MSGTSVARATSAGQHHAAGWMLAGVERPLVMASACVAVCAVAFVAAVSRGVGDPLSLAFVCLAMFAIGSAKTSTT